MLPNADRAVVDLAKLRDYVLSPDHARGRHKARVFAGVLGLRPADAEWLRDRILEAVLDAPAVETITTPYGTLYQADLRLGTSSGSAVVRTAWIVRRGETFPRLTTCFVL